MTKYEPGQIPAMVVVEKVSALQRRWLEKGVRWTIAPSDASPELVRPYVALEEGLPGHTLALEMMEDWSDILRTLRMATLTSAPNLRPIQLLVGHIDVQHPVQLSPDEDENGWNVWVTIAPSPMQPYIAVAGAKVWASLVHDILHQRTERVNLSSPEAFTQTFAKEMARRLVGST